MKSEVQGLVELSGALLGLTNSLFCSLWISLSGRKSLYLSLVVFLDWGKLNDALRLVDSHDSVDVILHCWNGVLPLAIWINANGVGPIIIWLRIVGGD